MGLYNDKVDSSWRVVWLRDVIPTGPYEAMGYHHTATEIHYTKADPMTYTQCDGSGEDWSSQCWYLTSSINDHMNYFNLYESCDEQIDWIVLPTVSPTAKPTAHINATESTQNEAAVTDVHRLENDSDS